jgi:hypothetical protein
MAPTVRAAEEEESEQARKVVGLAAFDPSGHLSPLAIYQRYALSKHARLVSS